MRQDRAGNVARTLFVLAMLACAWPASAQEPAGHELGLFEIRAHGYRTTVPVLIADETGEVLLPVATLFDLLGLTYHISGDPNDLASAVDSAVTRTDSLRLRPDQVEIYDGEVYVAVEGVEWLLAADVHVSWSELVVVVERIAPFPVEIAARTQRRRELAEQALARASRRGSQGQHPVPLPSSTGGGVLEWGVSSSSAAPVASTGVRGGLGLALMGGALNVNASGTPSADVWRTSVAYRRTFPEGRLVRTLEFGDMLAGNVYARGVRGFTLSNVRRIRDPFYGPLTVRPDVPTGWDFEVYRGGELLGFSSGAAEAVIVPLRYGTNPLTVRMISPTGEVIESEMPLHVPISQLPSGAFEYTTGAGICSGEDCRAYGFANGSLGLARWLTLGSGIEYVRLSADEDLLRGHGSLSASSLRGYMADLRYAPGQLAEARFAYGGGGLLTVQAGGGIAHPETARPSVVATTTRRLYADGNVGVRFRPTAPAGIRNLRLGGRIDAPEGGTAFWRVNSFASFRRWYHDVRYESSPDASDLVSLRSTWITPTRWPRPLRNTSLSGSTGVRGRAVDFVETSASVQMDGRGSLNLSARWTARQPTLQLSFTRTLSGARIQSRASHTHSGPRASVSADGVVVLGAPSGIRSSARSGMGLAGVSGRVFLDNNRNGIFDEGDEPADSIPVIAGGSVVHTDGRGYYSSWGIAPHERTTVSLDTLNTPDPHLVSLHGPRTVRLVPNVFRTIDIPLVRTVEVVGRLVPEGVPTVAGVTVEIHDLREGTTRTELTFSDGQFYISRMRPGEYRITIAASSLAALRGRADPEELRFTAGVEDVLDLPPITIRPR